MALLTPKAVWPPPPVILKSEPGLRVVGIDSTFWGEVRAAQEMNLSSPSESCVCRGCARSGSCVESCGELLAYILAWRSQARAFCSLCIQCSQRPKMATELMPDSLSAWLGGGGDGVRVAVRSVHICLTALVCIFS